MIRKDETNISKQHQKMQQMHNQTLPLVSHQETHQTHNQNQPLQPNVKEYIKYSIKTQSLSLTSRRTTFIQVTPGHTATSVDGFLLISV